MSGPFTWDELKKEAHGNIIVSPLGAVDKAGEPGKLRIIRDLSFKGRAPFSVNDRINKNAFTTKWGTAAMVIDLVHVYYLFPLSILQPRWHLSSSSLLASAWSWTNPFASLHCVRVLIQVSLHHVRVSSFVLLLRVRVLLHCVSMGVAP